MKGTNGITLISMVITIIVILILSVITTNLLFGENGILNQVENAKEKNQQSQKEEQEILAKAEKTIEEYQKQEASKVDDENPGVLEGEGIEDNPYRISSIEDLVSFSNEVNNGNDFKGKYIRLEKELDFKSVNSYVNFNSTEFGDLNLDGNVDGILTELTTGRGFTPIGNYNSVELPFSGIFDGNKKYIRNLYINIKEEDTEIDVGLFGYVKNGMIEDLYIIDCDICVETYRSLAGGIAGVQDGMVCRCAVIGKIVAKGSKVESSLLTGGISGTCSLAGNNVEIDGCYNMAEIMSINSDTSIREKKLTNAVSGGIVGFVQGRNATVSNCYNKGNVSSESYQQAISGGIVGMIGGNSEIESIQNFADLVGGNVENCYNIGKVSGKIKSEDGYVYAGSAIGVVFGNSTISNVYGINENEIIASERLEWKYPNKIDNVASKTENELKSESFLQSLGYMFKKDSSVINLGFPILLWQ